MVAGLIPAGLLLLAGAVGASPAWAQSPSVRADESGAVSGVVVVSAPVERVWEVVRDPSATGRASGSDLRVRRVAAAGECVDYAYVVPSVVKDLRYTVRLCPTDDGSVATLLESDDLSAYTSRWRARPTAAGSTRLEYTVHLIPDLPVPDWMVESQTKRAVARSLANIAENLAAGEHERVSGAGR